MIAVMTHENVHRSITTQGIRLFSNFQISWGHP